MEAGKKTPNEPLWRPARKRFSVSYLCSCSVLCFLFLFFCYDSRIARLPMCQASQLYQPASNTSCTSQLLIPAVPASNTNHCSLKSIRSSSSTYSITGGYAGPQSVLSCATSLSTSRQMRSSSTASCRILRRSSRLGAGVVLALRATSFANAKSSAWNWAWDISEK